MTRMAPTSLSYVAGSQEKGLCDLSYPAVSHPGSLTSSKSDHSSPSLGAPVTDRDMSQHPLASTLKSPVSRPGHVPPRAPCPHPTLD